MATKTRSKRTAPKARRDVHAEMTAKVLELLEAGTIPWQKPWNGAVDAPRSVHGRPYRGWNALWLSFLRQAKGYESPFWITYKQAQARGTVRKGEKGTMVVLWKFTEREDADTGEKRSSVFLTSYTVFNLDQCDGVPSPALPESLEFVPEDRAEELISGMPQRPTMTHGGEAAYYAPLIDVVNLPSRESFKSVDGYYATAFHELAHSTGHESRLNRKGIVDHNSFGSESYAQEELVAEFAGSFLMGEAGLGEKTIENTAAYIKTWIARLTADPTILVKAAGQAQKAADWIAGASEDDAPAEGES